MIPAKLLLRCTGDASTAVLVDAASGQVWEPPGDLLLDVHYQTPDKPWLVPPVYERDSQGNAQALRVPGQPAPPVDRALVTLSLPDGGTILLTPALEVPPGTPPFRLVGCRKVKEAQP
jgi:hypothetical protein